MWHILEAKIDGTQNYLVFQPVYKYFERMSNNVSYVNS